MTKFNYVGELCGDRRPKLIEVNFDDRKNIEKGTPVFTNINVVGVTTYTTGKFTGVVAENYEQESDELGLNHKAGKNKLLVNVSKDSVYTMKANSVVTATGSDGLIAYFDVPVGNKPPVGLKGAKFILAEKGEGSTNPFEIGEVFTLSQTLIFSEQMEYWFPVALECCAGDKYIFIPSFGFEGLLFDESGDFTVDFAAAGNVFVLDSDAEKRTITLKFKETV